jgi:hypothetical protein
MSGKYGHGLALAPRAEALSEAFFRLDGPAALRLLLAQHTMGRSLDEIEATTLEPALTKIGELWLRGRVDDAWFDEFSDLALSVERQFRRAIVFPGNRA